MTYDQIEKELLSSLPELREPIKDAFAPDYDLETERPGGYLIFEDVVFGFVLDVLSKGQNQNVLTRLFNFFEDMALSEDPNVTDLLRIAILESLVGNQENYKRAWPYMGLKTKEFAALEARVSISKTTPFP